MEINKYAPLFEDLGLSESDQRLIAPFFTNLDKSVYGVSLLPPEVVGALCSRTSRAKDDLRLALLNEYIKPFLSIDETEISEKMKSQGKTDEEVRQELERLSKYSRNLSALINFLHEHPTDEIFNNPKAREFYIKWLAQFGDDSIAQMAGTHLVYTGISQLAIKQIEDMRLGIAPIEKSTRYVDYSSKVNGGYRYYTDPTLESMGLLEKYKYAMDNLFVTYTDLLAEY
ncbi:MAG: hypothetical protein FJZ43_01140, partial [Candidatus Staskawiczbacteria bacterium]|nr:hypothetical protein [Candidatus Staskawiczbacteria bacterium]